jgi:hypothetical protein
MLQFDYIRKSSRKRKKKEKCQKYRPDASSRYLSFELWPKSIYCIVSFMLLLSNFLM